ncbi:MAG: SMP-30/gluconolactonase/LRE family protein [Steroidobacteraceae bacterium]
MKMSSVKMLGVSLLWFGAMSVQAEELVTPVIKGVVAAGTRIEFIKEGFQGTEGPVALPDGTLIFTETQANRITRIAADGSTSSYLENTNGANGLGFNKQGELVAVLTGKPGIGVLYPQDKARVLVDSYQGKALGRPNDLAVARNGGVYFTDPGANAAAGQPPSPTAVYYLNPKGELHLLASDVPRPNGIQLSPDEKTLYVANTYGEYVLAYDINKDGTVGKRRDFAKLEGYRKTDTGTSSGADGLAIDAQGRLYVASTAGVQVFSSKGEHLGTIALPKAPQNLAFAGKNKQVLYIVGRGAAYRIDTQARGYAGRAK